MGFGLSWAQFTGITIVHMLEPAKWWKYHVQLLTVPLLKMPLF